MLYIQDANCIPGQHADSDPGRTPVMREKATSDPTRRRPGMPGLVAASKLGSAIRLRSFQSTRRMRRVGASSSGLGDGVC